MTHSRRVAIPCCSDRILRGQRLQEMVKLAFENGINMFDTAEGYGRGRSEAEVCVTSILFWFQRAFTI